MTVYLFCGVTLKYLETVQIWSKNLIINNMWFTWRTNYVRFFAHFERCVNEYLSERNMFQVDVANMQYTVYSAYTLFLCGRSIYCTTVLTLCVVYSQTKAASAAPQQLRTGVSYPSGLPRPFCSLLGGVSKLWRKPMQMEVLSSELVDILFKTGSAQNCFP